MAGNVDHRARKRDIIAKAIPIFARVGYRDLTFQMLSERTGVARTVLYRYFRNKRQIFDSAILVITGRTAEKNAEIMHSGASCAERLRRVLTTGTATLFDNREFLCVVIDFVMSMDRAGRHASRRIPQFTNGLRRILRALVAEGVHKGEFRSEINPDRAVNILYGIFEATVLRLTVSNDAVLADALDAFDVLVKGLVRS